MMWSYFGNGYGKGVHDGDGVVLKQEIWEEHMRMDSEQLQNAADVVAYYEREQNEQTCSLSKCMEGCGLLPWPSEA
jgi:hypothetical protein